MTQAKTFDDTVQLEPESQAYHHAHAAWDAFHTRVKSIDPDGEACANGNMPSEAVCSLLRSLPSGERRPAAFGVFVLHGRSWSPVSQSAYLGEFLPNPSPPERNLLEAAAKGVVRDPGRLPVTLEEFPSRIWHRALASRSPMRLAGSAVLALDAAIRLIRHHQDHADLEDSMSPVSPSGDLSGWTDLIALAPPSTRHLKTRILDRIMTEVGEGRFEPSAGDLAAIKAWIFSNTADGPSLAEQLASEATRKAQPRIANGQARYPYDTRRLGRLMFRLGLRQVARQCAKTLGDSCTAMGWQFQVLSAPVHARIRRMALRSAGDPDAWLREPALACSSMTIPLWLADGVERVSALTSLFNKATECPWIFPRLRHIFLWHLALAGKPMDVPGCLSP